MESTTEDKPSVQLNSYFYNIKQKILKNEPEYYESNSALFDAFISESGTATK